MKRGIEVKFSQIANVLIGTCLHLPEYVEGKLEIIDEAGYKISSNSSNPQFISHNWLNLSSTNKDCSYFSCQYDSCTEAHMAHFHFQRMIDEFNERYCKKQILNNTEKEYLKNILRPLKVKDIKITKVEDIHNTAFIGISYRSNILNNELDVIVLPVFEKNSMYKNMEFNRHYTLDELGLFKEAQA